MTTPDSKLGKTVLMIAHVVGMIDLVALPIWVGVLMQHNGYGPRDAGITVTLFLLGVVTASLVCAPRFNRWPRRPLAAAGFALGAVAFAAAGFLPVSEASFTPLAALHAVAGLGVGCALSVTHGCIGRSANPHGLFALAGAVLGAFAVLFLGGMPHAVQARGGALLFGAFAGLMAFASACVLAAFPSVPVDTADASAAERRQAPIARPAWLAISVVVCMALNQAMVFAFLERIGASRGFGSDRVNGVLLAVGLINLTPAVLALLLQKRLAAQHVALVAPALQAALAFVIASSTTFLPYALAGSVYVFVMIFTHTFLFGLIARLDPSGRAVAATPAMVMLGAAIGPGLGGGVAQAMGYSGIGWVSVIVAGFAITMMMAVIRELSRSPALAARANATRTGH